MSEDTTESMSACKITAEWDEGKEDDFKELHRAIHNGQAQKFTALDDVEDTSSEEDDEEPQEVGPRLLWAAQHGHALLLEELLSADTALIHFRDADGYTALHRAAYSHQTDCLKLLLLHGADLNAVTPEGWTPLHSACRWNAHDCVEILLAQGANVNHVTEGGQTPLHLAAFAGHSRQTLQLLFLHPDLRCNSKNCQGDTAKDIALRNGNCVRLFDLVEPAVTNEEET